MNKKHYCNKCNSELEETMVPAGYQEGKATFHINLRCPRKSENFLMKHFDGHCEWMACIYRDEYGGVPVRVDEQQNLISY